MDTTLERILSLLPHKPDGSLVHGAKKLFCEKVGLAPNTVTEWIAGRSQSYYRYLYQIAEAFGVSVVWLKGETSEKKPAAQTDDGLSPEEKNRRERLALLNDLFLRLTPAEQERFLGRLEGIALSRANQDTP